MAKEVLTSQKWGSTCSDDSIKIRGRNKILTTFTLTRDSPDRGEDKGNLLGESNGSWPPFQGSSSDDYEVRNDFWFNSVNYTCRDLVEPFVKLFVSKEESVPMTRYIDVTRATSTSLDVILKKSIDDCWNVDGHRDFSGTRTDFTSLSILDENPLGWIYMIQGATDKKVNDIQTRFSVTRNMGWHVRSADTNREVKVDSWKTEAWQRKKITRYLLHWSSR